MNRSIVMVDWSRHNEPTSRTRDQFLWHQMLLSLLYDEVLAQDETLVCSEKMAGWFRDSQSFGLLEQLVECGGLTVLKRPWERYPEYLQDRALEQPISARREQLERFSVDNDGAQLHFKPSQVEFHSRLEALLSKHHHSHRHAGSRKKLGKDLMQEFSNLLATVLTDRRYEKWLRTKFKNVTPQIANEFVTFLRDPNRAIKHLEAERPDHLPRYTPQSGRPVFSTALAVQVAATYGNKEAKQLQGLIETVFARPFCQDEGAEGRYGYALRDLPLPMEGEQEGATRVVKVKVELVDRIFLSLPAPGPNFADIIQKLREKDSAKQLRNAMSQLGDDATFTAGKNAWQAVSADMASLVGSSNTKKIELSLVLVSAGRGAFCGAMADFLIHPPSSSQELVSRLPAPFVGALFDVGGGVCVKLAQADLERQRITSQLEQAVEFSCVPHPTVKSDNS